EWSRADSGVVQAGSTAGFTATPGFSEYRFLVNGDVRQKSASETFTYVPEDGDVVSLTAEMAGCSAVPDTSFTLTVIAANADLSDLAISGTVEPEWVFHTD